MADAMRASDVIVTAIGEGWMAGEWFLDWLEVYRKEPEEFICKKNVISACYIAASI
jgi:hypothetical protein